MSVVRFRLASSADRWAPRARRLLEKAGWPQAWLREFQTYLADPRMTPEEFWVRYTLKRIAAEPLLKPVMSEEDAREFYRTNDYMLWRNVVHRRHSVWYRVLATMPTKRGHLLEFGCGTAPISAWCRWHRPDWDYHVEDFESPHLDYARWRLGANGTRPEYDVITAIDVFEHLAHPEVSARRLVGELAPGGYLHWNFVENSHRTDLDLATPEQRDATVRYLEDALKLVWERDGYYIARPHPQEPA